MSQTRTTGGRRIGELAAATGLTVRTLHYYDEIGLLVASQRTEAGHRLYGADDVARLYRISLLRRLGLPLAEISKALDDPEWNLVAAMSAHLRQLDERLAAGSRLRSRLSQVAATATEADGPLTDDLLPILEDMTMLDSAVQKKISILVYADLEAAHAYLTRVFGLGTGELTRDDNGNVVHGELQAGDGVIWLHGETEEFGLASPEHLGSASGMVAVLVDDVDAHHRHAVTEGANVVYEPVDQPYGYREYGARDPEGHLWSFMKPLD